MEYLKCIYDYVILLAGKAYICNVIWMNFMAVLHLQKYMS